MSRFAVPLFFCISGFFFLKPDRQLEATARKLSHSFQLLFGAMMFYMCVTALGLTDISLKSYLHVFFSSEWLTRFFISNAPYRWPHLWFLGALVYIYLFALVWFGDGHWIRTAGPIGFLLLLGTMAFQEFAPWLPFPPVVPVDGMGHLRLCVLFVVRALPFFMIGIWLRLNETKVRNISISLLSCVALIILGGGLAIMEAVFTVNSQFYIGNYLMVAGMFIWAVKNPTHGCDALVFVGKNLSLYVYIGHIIVGFWIKSCFKYLGIVDTVAFLWLNPILVILFSMTISGIVYVSVHLLKIAIQNTLQPENAV